MVKSFVQLTVEWSVVVVVGALDACGALSFFKNSFSTQPFFFFHQSTSRSIIQGEPCESLCPPEGGITARGAGQRRPGTNRLQRTKPLGSFNFNKIKIINLSIYFQNSLLSILSCYYYSCS